MEQCVLVMFQLYIFESQLHRIANCKRSLLIFVTPSEYPFDERYVRMPETSSA
jgi:hypothetical protein